MDAQIPHRFLSCWRCSPAAGSIILTLLANSSGAVAEQQYRVVELGPAMEQAVYSGEFGMDQGRWAINDHGIISGNLPESAGIRLAEIVFPTISAHCVTYPLAIPLTAGGLMTTSCDLSEGIDPVVVGYIGGGGQGFEPIAAAWRSEEDWSMPAIGALGSAAFAIADDGQTMFGTARWKCAAIRPRRGTKWSLLAGDGPLALSGGTRLDGGGSEIHYSENAATTAHALLAREHGDPAGIGYGYRCEDPTLCEGEGTTVSLCFDAEWGLVYDGGEPRHVVPHGSWTRCSSDGELDTPRGVAIFARSTPHLYGHAQGGGVDPYGAPWDLTCNIDSGACDQCEDYATVWNSLGTSPVYLGHLPVASGYEHEASTVQGAKFVSNDVLDGAIRGETAVGTLTEIDSTQTSRRKAVRWLLSPDTGVWTGVALDELTGRSDLNLTQAHGVNADGWIIATAAPEDYLPGVAYVLIPIAPSCLADFDLDGAVAAADLSILLASWGPCGKSACVADLDCDGFVGAADLAILLSAWGPCS